MDKVELRGYGPPMKRYALAARGAAGEHLTEGRVMMVFIYETVENGQGNERETWWILYF
jgi:hypothetical protein